MTWFLVIVLIAGTAHTEGRLRSLGFRTQSECERALAWVRRTTLNEAYCEEGRL